MPAGAKRSRAATTCCTWPRPSQHVPKNEDELIVPAREGALRVLRAARDAGVKRVVLTSSFAAIGYGHPPQSAPFDENVWTDLVAATSCLTSNQRPWPSVRRGISSRTRAAGSELLRSSIRCWCSVRCSPPIFRPRSCSCSASWKAQSRLPAPLFSASWTYVTSPTCTCAP